MPRKKGQHTSAIPQPATLKYQRLSEESKERIRTATRLKAQEYQRNSTVTADRSGEQWTPEEDEFIVDHLEETIEDIAIQLGRTFYATKARWQRILTWLEQNGGELPAGLYEEQVRSVKREAPACACATLDGIHETWCPESE